MAAAQPANPPADEAQLAYTRKQFDRARALWSSRAESGDPAAQFGLGLLSDLGDAGPQDSAAAFEWFRLAAEAGMPTAQFNVAVMLDSGRGAPRDAAAAAFWYAKAAARGHGRAQFNLGLLYAAGEGVPRNPAQAAIWFTAAAAALPAAAERAASLRSAAAGASPPSPVTTLTPATPLSPAGALRWHQGAPRDVELIWEAPEQPERTRFFVEAISQGPDGQELLASYTDRTAMLLPLPDKTGSFAWRVFVVSDVNPRYLGSEWTRFTVE